MSEKKTFMYVSSWEEHGGAPGLGQYLVNQETGELQFVEMINTEDSFNASWVDARRGKLYVNNEVPCFKEGEGASGRIFVYGLDGENGRAREEGQIVTGCPNPAYVSLDHSGRYLFEAHHSCSMGVIRHSRDEKGEIRSRRICAEADVQVYSLDEAGMAKKLVENIDHNEYEKDREAHPHCAVFSPSGKLMAVADKGTGKLYLYAFDYEKEKLTLLNSQMTDREEGAPRYVVFHPDKPYLFVNHEASYDGKCYVTSFRYGEEGGLERVCVENVLDPELPVKKGTRLEQQGFVIDPQGNYLYTLINAADVIAVMKIDQETGKLSHIRSCGVPGNRPRGLAMFPNGRFLLSMCLVGGELTVFAIGEEGRLTAVEQKYKQPGASYASFYEPQ